MSGTRKEVAEAILELTYVEMMELGSQLAESIKTDREDGIKFDPSNRDQVCDRLRWWAEGFIDTLEDQK